MTSDRILAPNETKPLKDRKEEAAQNVNFYAARIKAKKINNIYFLDDLQELYQNLHELFYLTKQQMAGKRRLYGKIELITCVEDWLNQTDVKREYEYGINLSLVYLDALIIEGVIKP